MRTAAISEAARKISAAGCKFSDWELESVLRFALRTGDEELTDKMIEELKGCNTEEARKQIFQKYFALLGVQPVWVTRIENLLVFTEMYRIEQEKTLAHLAEALEMYGIEVSDEQLRRADVGEIREKVEEFRKEHEKDEEVQPECTLRNMTL